MPNYQGGQSHYTAFCKCLKINRVHKIQIYLILLLPAWNCQHLTKCQLPNGQLNLLPTHCHTKLIAAIRKRKEITIYIKKRTAKSRLSGEGKASSIISICVNIIYLCTSLLCPCLSVLHYILHLFRNNYVVKISYINNLNRLLYISPI